MKPLAGAFCALLAALLTGCATPVPNVVKIPVPVPCAPPDTPERPAMTPNAELAKMDDQALILTIAAERLEQGAYAAQAEVILKACR